MKRKTISTQIDPYRPENVALFEAIYGKNLISLGGLAAIDNMFLDLDVKGLKALDLGFGLGGVAFYLAEKYQMIISGIEVYPWMVQYAKDHTPKNLTQQLEFNIYTADGKLPYAPETFDLVYSKGVLNHVAGKETLFYQINSVLKPVGLFVIADWIFPHITTHDSAPLVCETKDSYERVLSKTGFSEIKFRDDSKIFLGYTKQLLESLAKNQEFIEQEYSKEVFSAVWKQHEELIKKINQNQQFATRIVAKKTS